MCSRIWKILSAKSLDFSLSFPFVSGLSLAGGLKKQRKVLPETGNKMVFENEKDHNILWSEKK